MVLVFDPVKGHQLIVKHLEMIYIKLTTSGMILYILLH